MHTPRFIGSFDLSKPRIEIDEVDIVHQITRVLRMHNSEEILLCDGKGGEVRTWIVDIMRDKVTVEALSKNKNESESQRHVVLYCAILKRENFEWVVQKATEVGVKEIIPLITHRTVKLDCKEDRLKKIIQEAAEQSGRIVVPILHPPMKFGDATTHAKDNDINLFFDPHGKLWEFNSHSLVEKAERVGIFIGPEGGWDDDEMGAAKKNKFKFVSLGKLILRAETAAVVASYISVLGTHES